MNISAIMTCHNRKEKTLRCLRCLYKALETYSKTNVYGKVYLSVFLTDDGCTDGTREAIEKEFVNHDITIIKGDGNLYWAGGMIKAWKTALNSNDDIDFYLLLNDDSYAFTSLFEELLATHQYCIKTFGKSGIYSGITCDENNKNIITYSGDIFDSKGRIHRIKPTGKPQRVDITNANFLLVPKDVVHDIGILYDGFRHSAADNDYSIQANRHGHPALITAQICGFCKYDHKSAKEETLQLLKMNLKQRYKYLHHPLHSDSEYLIYIKRNFPKKYPLTLALRVLRLFFPYLYYKINKIRGIY